MNSLRLREGDETAYAPILPLNTSMMVQGKSLLRK